MQALVVGADRLGNIPDLLAQSGISIFRHITGRDRAHQKTQVALPKGTQLVILFTDFLGHNVMQRFRAAARDEGVPLLCCRRSVCSLRQALDAFGACPKDAACAGCERAAERMA